MEKDKLLYDLKNIIYKYERENEFSNIVILCVGTNKIIGDLFGPIVGKKLIQSIKRKDIIIYGNTKNTVNFSNAKSILEKVFFEYRKPFIITIDAALGNENMIEKVFVTSGKIKIGDSLGRYICYNSQINIKGVVGKDNKNAKENLKTVKRVNPKIIENLSNTVVYGIEKMVDKIKLK